MPETEQPLEGIENLSRNKSGLEKTIRTWKKWKAWNAILAKYSWKRQNEDAFLKIQSLYKMILLLEYELNGQNL